MPFTLPFTFAFAFDFYGCELCMNVSIVGYSFDRQRVLGTAPAAPTLLLLSMLIAMAKFKLQQQLKNAAPAKRTTTPKLLAGGAGSAD